MNSLGCGVPFKSRNRTSPSELGVLIKPCYSEVPLCLRGSKEQETKNAFLPLDPPADCLVGSYPGFATGSLGSYQRYVCKSPPAHRSFLYRGNGHHRGDRRPGAGTCLFRLEHWCFPRLLLRHLASVPHRPEVLWSLLVVSVALVVGLAREKWSSAEMLAG